MGILSPLFGSGEDTRTASAEPAKLTPYYIVGEDETRPRRDVDGTIEETIS
jgi:hypothetical protein